MHISLRANEFNKIIPSFLIEYAYGNMGGQKYVSWNIFLGEMFFISLGIYSEYEEHYILRNIHFKLFQWLMPRTRGVKIVRKYVLDFKAPLMTK